MKSCDFLPQYIHRIRIPRVVYMLAGVNGEEGVASLYEWRNIFQCFQMIGICTPRGIPSCGIDRAPGIVHDLLRSTSSTRVFTDGLLRKDWSEFCPMYGSDMTRRRKTQPVTKTKRGMKVKRRQHIIFLDLRRIYRNAQ